MGYSLSTENELGGLYYRWTSLNGEMHADSATPRCIYGKAAFFKVNRCFEIKTELNA